ncbi:ankyrin repeat-containing domain protein [Aspergillus granulosus]|uniref:Ankyrin repeat-containing domain protein n=1 Tax=Aspergillus granulosus TaxID=176169 RepID=A0ABR4H6L4_9EURO
MPQIRSERSGSLLLSLPDELILLIGEELSSRSLNALIRASKRLYFALSASIYTVTLQRCDTSFIHEAVKFCARNGNLVAIKNFLAYYSPQENLTKYNWLPALEEAAKHGHDHVLRFILDLDPSYKPHSLERLMKEAATGNHVKAVETLIDAGFDVSSHRELFYCPLSQAAMAYQGDPATVRLLCDRGAYKFASDEDEEIVLHKLARIGSFDMTKFFLDLGYPVDPQNADGSTPLFLAIDAQHYSVTLLLLLRGASVSIRDGAGLNVLHRASLQRGASAASIVQLLLHHGADPNERSGTNKTPLYLATRRRGGDRDVIKALLAGGADCCAIVDENDKTTPLQNVMRQSDAGSPSHDCVGYTSWSF